MPEEAVRQRIARFRGQSDHTLDEKGRLNIPSRFLDVLRAVGDDQHLMVLAWKNHVKAYPAPEWERVEERLFSSLGANPENKKMFKHMISSVVECQLKQGRVLLPPKMREDCGIRREVVLAGFMNMFEIWDKQFWEQENKPSAEDFDTFEAALSAHGLF